MQNEALLDSFINPERILCVIIYYRPQTKFAKVMFSQVFVCTRGGSLSGGSLSSWSLSGGGICPGWGVSVQVGGSLSKGVLCQGYPRTVTSGWYASYWNAFLLSRPFISCCFFEDASPFLWGPLIPLFWTSGDVSSGFQSHSEHPWTSGDVSSLFQSHNGQSYSHLVEAYVLQIPRDSPLVRHLPTPANIADRL